MITIPQPLYSKEILQVIDDAITFDDVKSFDDLDEIQQDKLVSLGLAALDTDIDLLLSNKAKLSLTRLLRSYDRDDEIDLVQAIKDEAKNQFSDYFNYLFEEILSDRQSALNYEHGLSLYTDPVNGEAIWR